MSYLRTAVVPGRELDHHLGPDHLHGPARLLPLADDEADAEDEADRRSRPTPTRPSSGRRSPAPTRRRRSCRRSWTSSRTRPASRRSARASRRASCSTARPAPARRCWPRPSRKESGAKFYAQSAVLVRGDVRRPRRRPHPAAVPDRPRQPPRDHLHRRDRRRRRRARLGQQLRARADAQPAAGRDGRLPLLRRPRRDRGLEPARQARPGAAAPGPLRPPDLRLPARRGRPRGDHARAHRGQAAGRRRRPRDPRAPDLGPDRRRPRQPLQRGGDLRRPLAPRGDRPVRLRLRAGARRGRHAVAPHAQRARAPRRRLPRGRPRALRRAAAGRQPRAQDLDRAARQGAGLHAQPPGGGPLPEDQGGADRLHVGAARRPRGGGARVRLDHHRRRRRPAPRGGDLALDGPRLRDGHLDHLAQGLGRGRPGLRPHAPAARRGAAAPLRRGDARAR